MHQSVHGRTNFIVMSLQSETEEEDMLADRPPFPRNFGTEPVTTSVRVSLDTRRNARTLVDLLLGEHYLTSVSA
jgi:hypothetical protein